MCKHTQSPWRSYLFNSDGVTSKPGTIATHITAMQNVQPCIKMKRKRFENKGFLWRGFRCIQHCWFLWQFICLFGHTQICALACSEFILQVPTLAYIYIYIWTRNFCPKSADIHICRDTNSSTRAVLWPRRQTSATCQSAVVRQESNVLMWLAELDSVHLQKLNWTSPKLSTPASGGHPLHRKWSLVWPQHRSTKSDVM